MHTCMSASFAARRAASRQTCSARGMLWGEGRGRGSRQVGGTRRRGRTGRRRLQQGGPAATLTSPARWHGRPAGRPPHWHRRRSRAQYTATPAPAWAGHADAGLGQATGQQDRRAASSVPPKSACAKSPPQPACATSVFDCPKADARRCARARLDASLELERLLLQLDRGPGGSRCLGLLTRDCRTPPLALGLTLQGRQPLLETGNLSWGAAKASVDAAPMRPKQNMTTNPPAPNSQTPPTDTLRHTAPTCVSQADSLASASACAARISPCSACRVRVGQEMGRAGLQVRAAAAVSISRHRAGTAAPHWPLRSSTPGQSRLRPRAPSPAAVAPWPRPPRAASPPQPRPPPAYAARAP